MQVVDLSVPIVDGTDWYNEPGTDPVRISDNGSIDKEGWVSHTVRIQVLNGTTYLETSAHLYPDGPTLDKIPPERFLCRAFVVRLPPGERELPAPDDELIDFRAGDDAILLHCGWDAQLGSPDFYGDSPYFSTALQSWILDLNPSILGGDMVSFDHPADAEMPFLRTYFMSGGMILCPLVGLGQVERDTVTMCAAPMKLAGANAAPCRVFVW